MGAWGCSSASWLSRCSWSPLGLGWGALHGEPSCPDYPAEHAVREMSTYFRCCLVSVGRGLEPTGRPPRAGTGSGLSSAAHSQE